MKTPHELALAISALINSKPRSPTVEELEGVIGEHWKPEAVKPIPMTGVAAHLKPPMISVSDVVRKDVFFGAGGISSADGSPLPPSSAWIAKHFPDTAHSDSVLTHDERTALMHKLAVSPGGLDDIERAIGTYIKTEMVTA